MLENIINIILGETKGERIQMFSTPNVVGDRMEILWVNPENHSNYVALCPGYWYVECLGFTEEEFDKIFAACGE